MDDDNRQCHTIQQGDGGEQGDALMPALFCLGLHQALRRIQSALPPGADILAYLDDVYVVCDPDEVDHILQITRHELLTSCHINVNIGKLAIWGPTPAPCPIAMAETTREAWQADKPEAERGIKVFGTRFGTNA